MPVEQQVAFLLVYVVPLVVVVGSVLLFWNGAAEFTLKHIVPILTAVAEILVWFSIAASVVIVFGWLCILSGR